MRNTDITTKQKFFIWLVVTSKVVLKTQGITQTLLMTQVVPSLLTKKVVIVKMLQILRTLLENTIPKKTIMEARSSTSIALDQTNTMAPKTREVEAMDMEPIVTTVPSPLNIVSKIFSQISTSVMMILKKSGKF